VKELTVLKNLSPTWGRSPKRRRACPTRFRPVIEACEGRTLPSTCTVTNLGDTGAGSGQEGDLRYCLEFANQNSEPSNRIVFADGLSGKITLVKGELDILKDLAIDGPGASVLSVSGGHHSGVFFIPSTAGAVNVSIDDLTVTEGIGVSDVGWREGGGLLNNYGHVGLTRVTVTANVLNDQLSSSGGGIANRYGTMTLDSCVVSDNAVLSGGGAGGIKNGGTMTLVDTVVSGNRAKDFAGISNDDKGNLTVLRSTITKNQAAESAAGIDNLGVVTVSESTISDNIAPGGGAALYNITGSITVHDTTIAGNRGTAVDTQSWTDISNSTIADNHGDQGGGFYVYGGTLRLTNSTLSGNISDTSGGAIDTVSFDPMPPALVEVTACTISANVAKGGFSGKGGGGIEVVKTSQGSARVVMDSSIVAGNQSNGSGPDVDGVVISLGFNFIGNGDGSTGWAATDAVGTPSAPLDPKLGPLGDYGGKTWTHALPAGSPAIKKGDPALGGSYDQRGTWRQPYFNPDPGAFQTSDALVLQITAPDRALKGKAFRFTVTAIDAQGNRATLGLGTVHFTSSDPLAQLPPDYAFQGSDLGTHTFTVTLNTVGTQQVTVKDSDGFPSGTATIVVQDPSGRWEPPSTLLDADWLDSPTGGRFLRRRSRR
jgi:hypothetical protein